eukprot:jgi/Botrbrau1/1553/Bobra.0107s0041.1
MRGAGGQGVPGGGGLADRRAAARPPHCAGREKLLNERLVDMRGQGSAAANRAANAEGRAARRESDLQAQAVRIAELEPRRPPTRLSLFRPSRMSRVCIPACLAEEGGRTAGGAEELQRTVAEASEQLRELEEKVHALELARLEAAESEGSGKEKTQFWDLLLMGPNAQKKRPSSSKAGGPGGSGGSVPVGAPSRRTGGPSGAPGSPAQETAPLEATSADQVVGNGQAEHSQPS